MVHNSIKDSLKFASIDDDLYSLNWIFISIRFLFIFVLECTISTELNSLELNILSFDLFSRSLQR